MRRSILNRVLPVAASLLATLPLAAQSPTTTSQELWSSPGVIGTVVLIAIVLMVGALIMVSRINSYFNKAQRSDKADRKADFVQELTALDTEDLDQILEHRRKALGYRMSGKELGGEMSPSDPRGLVAKVTAKPDNPLVDEKQRSTVAITTSPGLKKLVLYYIGAATAWLVFGTLVGEYLGFKFIWPEMDSIRWLSFGRLRPVHTNTVFWGWASLAMVGLAHFVVARTSNREIHSLKWGWWSWWLINLSVLIGNISLMAGINNGGGEYREYIWPIMLLFAIALIITFFNFYKTVATRKIGEIYISNWYILAALLWTIVLSVIGYLPMYQGGMGETVIQGYYMHMGVGMWFMTFTLGLVYYHLPASLNRPIYSYSLGVLAFWTQMLFYTMIGTHHFIFSPLPWWLQTIAIVFSLGMFIPVIAGTTNFLMTMRGSFKSIGTSYVLPFFLVGVIFYFVGSSQGSFQAFRFTNYIWHFTDFNVAHSHMTMYGIICFLLWACIYALLPKLTGKEPPQLLVGAHFWLAFVGLSAYMISLMTGGTMKGLSWMDQNPFIDSVTLMMPFWVSRAIGGTLMFIAHLVFAYNFYIMVKGPLKTPALSTPDITTS